MPLFFVVMGFRTESSGIYRNLFEGAIAFFRQGGAGYTLPTKQLKLFFWICFFDFHADGISKIGNRCSPEGASF